MIQCFSIPSFCLLEFFRICPGLHHQHYTPLNSGLPPLMWGMAWWSESLAKASGQWLTNESREAASHHNGACVVVRQEGQGNMPKELLSPTSLISFVLLTLQAGSWGEGFQKEMNTHGYVTFACHLMVPIPLVDGPFLLKSNGESEKSLLTQPHCT